MYPESFQTQRYATECTQPEVALLLVLSLLGKLVKKKKSLVSGTNLKILSVMVNTNQAEDHTDADNDEMDYETVKSIMRG